MENVQLKPFGGDAPPPKILNVHDDSDNEETISVYVSGFYPFKLTNGEIHTCSFTQPFLCVIKFYWLRLDINKHIFTW